MTTTTKPSAEQRQRALADITQLINQLRPTCRLLAEAVETAADEPGIPSLRHYAIIQYLASEVRDDLRAIEQACTPLLIVKTDVEALYHDSEGGEL